MPSGQHHSKCKRQEHLQTLSCRTAEVLLTFARAQFRGAPVVAGPGAPQDGPDISWYEMIWCIKQGGRLRAVQLVFITSFIIVIMIDWHWLVMHYLQVWSFASIWRLWRVSISQYLLHAAWEYLAMTCRGLRKCPARFGSRGAEGGKLDRVIPLSKQTTWFCGFHGFWSLQEFNK